MQQVSIFWFRRDLRLFDNAGFYHALKSGYPVLPIFVFDKHILDELEDDDRRVTFIHETISALNEQLKAHKSGLLTFYSTPKEAFQKLQKEYEIKGVFVNRDYEPYAIQRDKQIAQQLGDIPFYSFKDQVIFEQNEIVKDDDSPYKVWTPYSKKWKASLNAFYLKSYPNGKFKNALLNLKVPELVSLKFMGFKRQELDIPSTKIEAALLHDYANKRDFPAVKGTSRLSLHLRFGTKSVRALSRFALDHSEKFLNELIWREFYQSILFHFPHVVSRCFRPKYDAMVWRNNTEEFAAWCAGQTGYPIVDAGMRELNTTGWMHNRVRMIVASFLVKHLLIDWRWGEAYFAQHLLDYDLASNNGGWQWAAGTGVDAAPYFRIFNPYSQTKKFDSDLAYIKKWVPEFESFDYPKPIVDHAMARERCLAAYKSVS